MLTQCNADFYTVIWMGVYGVGAGLFFLIALWIVVRGGKDVAEILNEAWKKK